MSGSSLDGLDVALIRFTYRTEPEYALLDWDILAGDTLPYPAPWRARLRTAPHLPAPELWRLHADLGKYFGKTTRRWLQEKPPAELLGSHGHTVYHDPARNFTTQVGDGAQLAHHVGLPTVTDLRSSDIAAGGQGAPIAPLADRYLFPEHTAFLNLGGIANLSLKTGVAAIVAGDVSGANQIMDRLAAQRQLPYDAGGKLARSGRMDAELFQRLEDLPFHAQPYPKSLGNDWVQGPLWDCLAGSPAPVEDKLRTFVEFLAQRIGGDLTALAEQHQLTPAPRKVLVTGGGAHNEFLLERLRQQPQHEHYPFGYEVPPLPVADLKEAALVAICALHRHLERPNALASATGARSDTVNGALYLP